MLPFSSKLTHEPIICLPLCTGKIVSGHKTQVCVCVGVYLGRGWCQLWRNNISTVVESLTSHLFKYCLFGFSRCCWFWMCYEPCYQRSTCEPGRSFSFTPCLFYPLRLIDLCSDLKCNANVANIDTATVNEVCTICIEANVTCYPLFPFCTVLK